VVACCHSGGHGDTRRAVAFSAASQDHIPPFAVLSPQTVVSVHVVAFAGFYIIRLVGSRVAEHGTFKRRILVLGPAFAVQRVRTLERERRPSQFMCVGSDSWDPTSPDNIGQRLPLMDVCRNTGAQEIVVFGEERLTTACAVELQKCRLGGMRVTTFASFVERETRRVEINDCNALTLVFADGPRRNSLSRGVKRAIDIAASLGILIFTLPVTATAALAIWLAGDGPIFYRQKRVGLGGRTFTLLKFRSMRVDAEADGVARWCESGDERVTTIGAFLRRSRIDEVPQLINVLRGEMSVVGPRPERPVLVEQLEKRIPLYGYRHLVPPGITGWAQINYPYGASFEDAVEKTCYDFYYIKNGSIVLDLIILLQTIRVVLMAEGSR